MANMSYVRFENTLSNLQDCLDHINDNTMSSREAGYRSALISTCQDIVDAHDPAFVCDADIPDEGGGLYKWRDSLSSNTIALCSSCIDELRGELYRDRNATTKDHDMVCDECGVTIDKWR